MADRTRGGPRWDTQGLGAGLVVGLLGIAFLLGRDGGGLRPVHLLGIVVLGIGAALLVTAIDRPTGSGPTPLDD